MRRALAGRAGDRLRQPVRFGAVDGKAHAAPSSRKYQNFKHTTSRHLVEQRRFQFCSLAASWRSDLYADQRGGFA